jgi:tRNA(Ile)-lysidine synthase
MLDRFINHVRKNKLLDVHKSYLLAISGGMDSVVLAHLLYRSGIRVSLAHCNFQLRGAESDADEDFVIKYGEQLGMPVHVKSFDTRAYMKEKTVSLQMAARDLRYAWLEKLNYQLGKNGVVVAQHADDQLETVLLNLLRGTGIEGLYGMSGKRDFIIRPLLPFSKQDIKAYLDKHALEWKEDSSNEKTIYKRNFIRHRLLPRFHEFDPKGPELIQYSFNRIKDTGKAFFHFFDLWIKTNVTFEKGYEILPFASLENVPGKASLLFYWLRKKGFVYAQIEDILWTMENNEPGKHFTANNHVLNIDRESLILREFTPEDAPIEIALGDDICVDAGRIRYTSQVLNTGEITDRSPENAVLDADLLEFPLVLRDWQPGDKFMPLGMKHFKKISDYLIDSKVPLIKKNKVKVLCSNGQIIWLVGLRIDERFKVYPATRRIIYLKKLKDD